MDSDEMSDASSSSSHEWSDDCQSSQIKRRKLSKLLCDYGFIQIDLEHSWNDLIDESKDEILESEVEFRKILFDLKLIFSKNYPPSAEVLDILSFDKKICIKPRKPKKLKNFIDRKFLRKSNVNQYEDHLSMKNFIDERRKDRVILISDLAGSGKTILLHKIHEILVKNFPSFWICFVSLREHKSLLLDKLKSPQNFLKVLTDEILNLNELEREIFKFKYLNNEVVILFDGFDEISPDCKQNSLKIFKLHQESEKSQIWITTRKHLEVDLEKELEVDAFKLAPLNENEQFELLCEFWRKSCNDSNVREKCAKLLVEKIKNIKKIWWRGSSLLGLTLQLRLLAEYLDGRLSEDFDELIKNLEICQVYEYLIDKSVNIKEKNSIYNNAKTHMRTYEAYALNYFFLEYDITRLSLINLDHMFGYDTIIEDLEEDVLQEFARGGIVFYDKNEKVFFTHLTYGEFLLSRFVQNKIKNFKRNWRFKEDFFNLLRIIIKDRDFAVVIMFLDDSFKDASLENLKPFTISFCEFITKEEIFNLFGNYSTSNLSDFSLFLLKSIRTENIRTFKNFIEYQNEENIFHKTLCNFENPIILEKLLDEIFEVYSDDSELFNLLMLRDENNCTIFHRFLKHDTKVENFHLFWSKIAERCFKNEKLFELFFAKDNEQNYFLKSVIGFDESGEAFTSVVEVIQSFSKEEQRKVFEKFKLSNLGYFKSKPKLLQVFDYLCELFEEETFLELLTNKEESGTILHVSVGSLDIFKTIFEKFEKLNEKYPENKIENFKNLILKKNIKGENVLMTIIRKKRFDHFFYILDKIENFLLFFKEICFETDDEGWNIFHFLSLMGNLATIEYFLDRSKIEFSEKELKNLFKMKTKKSQNVFHLLAHSSNLDAVRFFINFVSKILSRQEMREILLEVNFTDMIFGVPNNSRIEKEVFESIFECYEKFFKKNEIVKILRFKDKEGKSIIQYSPFLSPLIDVINNIHTKMSDNIEIPDFEIFQHFPDNLKLFEILVEKDFEGCTIIEELLHEKNFNAQKFKNFWSKIDERNFEYEKILEILLSKNQNGRNILNSLIKQISERKFLWFLQIDEARVDAVIDIVTQNLKAHDQRIFLEEVKIYELVTENVFAKVFQLMRTVFDNKEILKFFKEENEEGETILHIACRFHLTTFLKRVFEQIQNISIQDLKSFVLKKNKKGQNVFMITAGKMILNADNFCCIFNEIIPKICPLKEFVYELDDEGRNVIHYIVIHRDIKILQTFLNKAQNELSREEFYNLFKMKTREYKNVFHLLSETAHSDSIDLLIESFRQNLEKGEIKGILSEFDSSNKLPLHYAPNCTFLMEYQMIFKFYEESFEKEELLQFLHEENS